MVRIPRTRERFQFRTRVFQRLLSLVRPLVPFPFLDMLQLDDNQASPQDGIRLRPHGRSGSHLAHHAQFPVGLPALLGVANWRDFCLFGWFRYRVCSIAVLVRSHFRQRRCNRFLGRGEFRGIRAQKLSFRRDFLRIGQRFWRCGQRLGLLHRQRRFSVCGLRRPRFQTLFRLRILFLLLIKRSM